MELNDFISKYYTEVISRYKLYCEGWDSLKVGMKVKSLRAGFGGLGGQILKIINKVDNPDGKYLTLRSNGINYISYKNDDWFRDIEIIGM
jgi:hypothetical protein